MDTTTVWRGNCLDVLRKLADCSVSAKMLESLIHFSGDTRKVEVPA